MAEGPRTWKEVRKPKNKRGKRERRWWKPSDINLYVYAVKPPPSFEGGGAKLRCVHQTSENEWLAGTVGSDMDIDVGPFKTKEEAMQVAEQPGFVLIMQIRERDLDVGKEEWNVVRVR